MSENIRFHNEERTLNFDELINELVLFVQKKPEREYRIVVGTDSRASSPTRLVTAVSILRVGNGGRYFWTRSTEVFTHSMRERIFKETMQSIALTQEVRSRLRDRLGEEFFWDEKISVHLDVGRIGPTRDLIETVVGMVKGYGFEAVIKPDSFGAFVLADRHT